MYVTKNIQVTWWFYHISLNIWYKYYNNGYKWWLIIGPLQISKKYKDG